MMGGPTCYLRHQEEIAWAQRIGTVYHPPRSRQSQDGQQVTGRICCDVAGSFFKQVNSLE